jgi:outer membrane lipase/esterase
MRLPIFRHRSALAVALVVLAVLAASGASASGGSYERLVVFGDSLSDPGNHFVAFGTVSQAPFAPLPDFPYAIGGHHFSNGATWAEQLSRALGLPRSGKPALRRPGLFTNYAVGRARARAGAPEFPHFDLGTQVGRFLGDFRGQAPGDALYVLWIGANDLNDALRAGLVDPSQVPAIIEAAVTAQAGAVHALWAAGARTVLVANVPDPALTPLVRAMDPAVQAAATQVGALYNAALEQALGQVSALPGLTLIRFDVATVLGGIVASGGDGRLDITTPCLTFGVIADAVCERPRRFLFWDAAHLTRAGHRLIAEAALWLLDDAGDEGIGDDSGD